MAIKINPDILLKRSLVQRILILVVIDLFIAFLGYYFLISPTIDEVADLNQKLSSLNADIQEKRIIASDIEKFRQEKAALEATLAKYLEKLPNEKEIPDLIDSVSQAVKDVGLKIFLFKPNPERPKGFYAEVPIQMKVQGGFESFYEFCDKISKLPRIVNIENMAIKVKDESGSMESTFTVTTFRFIPEGQKAAPPRGKRRGKR